MFDSLNRYLEIKPGSVFADVGASSGYYTGAMAMYLDQVTFYIQDMDQECLNSRNLKNVLKHYSKLSETPIEDRNSIHIAIGSETKTNLPEDSIDIIYSNATFHALSKPDSIISDLYRSLKKFGTLSIRDEFTNGDEIKVCEEKKCGSTLVSVDFFMEIMNRNGFVLKDKTDDFGYPIYTFVKSSKKPAGD